MSEAYKGLTIEIGADASSLSAELKRVDSALADTQRQLRAVERALRLDPDNVALLAEKSRIASDRAGQLGERLRMMREAERSASEQAKELSRRLGDSATAMQRAREGYNETVRKLAELNQKYAEAGLNDQRFLQHLKEEYGIKGRVRSVEELREKLDALGVTQDAFRRKFSGQSWANGWISEYAGGLRELDARYKALSEEHAAWQRRLEDVSAAKSLERLKSDVEAARAEMRAAALEAVELDTRVSMLARDRALRTDGRSLSEELRLAGTSVASLRSECERLSRASEADAANLETFKLAAAATAEAVQAMEADVRLLREQLDAVSARAGDELGRPFEELARREEDARQSAATLRWELSAAEEALAELQGDARADLGGAQVKEQSARVEELRRRYDEAREALQRCMDAKRARELKVQIAALSAEVAALKESASALSAIMRGMKNAGYGLYSTITPALMGAGYAVVSRTEAIDSAYRDLRKTLEATEEEYGRLYASALEYSRDSVTSAASMLGTEALLAQVGVSKEMVAEVARTVSNLDIATSLSADELSTQLGQLITTMKIGEGGAASFGDSLVRLGNNMATNETQVMDVLSYMGSAATLYGFTADQALAWAAAMASTGQGAEASGSAFTRVMAMVETAAAGGGDSLAAFADTAGMTAGEFAALWADDPSAALAALVQGLADIDAAGGSVELTLQDLGVVNVRDKQLLRALTQEVYDAAGGQGVLYDALQMSHDAWNGVSDEWGQAGDAANEAEKKAEGFSGTLSKISNNADILAVRLGEACTPILGVFLGALQAASKAADAMPDGLLTAAEAAVALTAAAGPVAVATSSVYEAFKSLGSTVSKLNPKLVAAVKAMGALKRVAVTAGILAAAVALGTLVAKAGEAVERSNRLDKAFRGMSETIERGVDWGAQASGMGSAADSAAELASRLDEATASHAELADSLAGSLDDVRAQAGACAEYAGRLAELQGVDGRIDADGAAEAKVAVDALNDELGTNLSLVADADGRYELMNDGARLAAGGLDELTDAMLRQAETNAYQEAYEEAVKLRATYEAAYDEARQQAKELTIGRTSLSPRNLTDQDVDNFASGAWGEYEWTLSVGPDTTVLDNLVTAREGMEAASEQAEALRGRLLGVAGAQDGEAASASRAASATGVFAAATQEAADGASDAAGAAGEQADALEELREKAEEARGTVEDLSGSYYGFRSWLSEAGITAQDLADLVVSSGADLEAFADSYESTVADLRSSVSSLADDYESTVERLRNVDKPLADEAAEAPSARFFTDTLYQDNIIYLEWQANLDALRGYAGQAGDEASRQMMLDFVDGLEEMGPEYAATVADFLATPDAFESASWEWSQSAKHAGAHLAQDFADSLYQSNIAYLEWQADLDALRDYAAQTGDDSATQMMLELVDGLEEMGPEYAAVVHDMLSNPEAFASAAWEWSEAAKHTATHAGQDFADGMAEGIWASDAVTNAVKGAADRAAQAMQEARSALAGASSGGAGSSLAGTASSFLSGAASEASQARASGSQAGGAWAGGFKGGVEGADLPASLSTALSTVGEAAGESGTEAGKALANACAAALSESDQGKAVEAFYAGLGLALQAGSFDDAPDLKAQAQQAYDAFGVGMASADPDGAVEAMAATLAEGLRALDWGAATEGSTSGAPLAMAAHLAGEDWSPVGEAVSDSVAGQVASGVASGLERAAAASPGDAGGSWGAPVQAVRSAVESALSSGAAAEASSQVAEPFVVRAAVEVSPTSVELASPPVAANCHASAPVQVDAPVELSASDVDTSGLDSALQDAGEASGQYLGAGLTSGIDLISRQVAADAEAMGLGAVSGMNAGLGVNSPSVKGIESGRYLDEGLTLGIRSGAQAPVAASRAVAGAAASALSSASSGAWAAGYAVSSGMAAGVWAGSSLVRSAASSVALSALSSAKSALGIHSPSRAFRDEVGGNAVAGMAEGFRRYGRRASESAAAMASDALSSARSAVGEAHAASTGRTIGYEDVRAAVAQALSESDRTLTAQVYIDGRRLANATSRANDAALGRLATRRSR